ncbi:MAG: glycosyltransferase family 39 protein [Actinomycetota bacterium]|nr:glycosyltransferase family 39 protein [Actinomycetota bacterium]
MTVRELGEAPPKPGVNGPWAGRRPVLRAFTTSAVTVVALIVLGAAIRILVARQSLFADELSTYWIVATHGLGGVLALLNGTYPGISHAEITPPLFFVLSWFSSQLGHAPILLRMPSLVAGILTIPVVYRLGVRTVGRPAATLGTALTTLSPFMIYYSAEARSYGVMMLLTAASTVSMLKALETRRARWWAAYGACSCGAFYAHYTSVFYLIGQFVWLLWACREAWLPATTANCGAVVGLLPWAHGLINDLRSPTANILSFLSPFTPSTVVHSLAHWAIGFPYVEAGGVTALPGRPALVLLAVAALLALAGAARRFEWDRSLGLDRRVVLVVGLALSVPFGEALVSTFSTQLFGVRNLAASWPALALAAAWMGMASGPRLRYSVAALSIGAFALGAFKMLTVHYARPDFRDAAAFLERRVPPGAIVIDTTASLSPGPLSGLDVALPAGRFRVVRAGSRTEHTHPFGLADPVTSLQQGVSRAVAQSRGGRMFVVAFASQSAPVIQILSRRYSLVRSRLYPEFVPLEVDIFAPRGSRGR